MKRITPLFCLLLLAFVPAVLAADPTPEQVTFFETKIRPVLVERCYKCHSADAVKQDNLQGELLVDTRDALRQGGASGAAVVPGDVANSLLIAAIRHESFEMPPQSKLPKETINDFVKWVEMGAPDPRDGKAAQIAKEQIDIAAGKQFWSFQPLTDPQPPTIKNTAWAKTEIDPFILDRLEAKQLAPNPQASRRTLIRRAYYDLWGLPPAPADVEAFVKDPAPDAYAKLVDRLLAGKPYGERWARHWLDLARFAESNGYAFDKDRPAAFHYRDFIIKALNEDMPYDRFVQLQVAGDQMEPRNPLAHAATGFLAAGPFTSQQTQKERERSRYEQLDDIAGTFGTAMLGLTVGCARCHDHKFDPLPTHDYYRLIACFAETGFQDFDYDPDPEGTRQAKAAFDKKHQPYIDARTKFEKEVLADRLAAWLASDSEPPQLETLGTWYSLGPLQGENFKQAFANEFPVEKDFAKEKTVNTAKTFDELKWQAQPDWVDGQVHNTLTGDNSANYLYRTIEVPVPGPLEIKLGRDDSIKVWLNGKNVLAKEAAGPAAADQEKVTLQLESGVNHLLVKIVNAKDASGFYFSSKQDPPKNIADILKLAADKRNDQQQEALLKWFGSFDREWAVLNHAEQEHLKNQPVPDITKIFAARRNGVTYNFGPDTRKVYFLARGNSNSKQGEAAPGFLRVLMNTASEEKAWTEPPTSEDSSAAGSSAAPLPRIAMAQWLTDVDHGSGHLLARVIVNRLWQHHMGRGIVATPSDFGSQGAPPTHPELLDFLARELIRNGWRLKPVHKLIMLSAVYQQTGETNPAAAKVDPDNLLWWRRPAQRLEAEIIRDAMLAVSGSLDQKMFGAGSLNQEDGRRSVYLTVKRSSLIPILQLFDAPDSIQSIGNRNVTTVPPQALAMMNSSFVRKIAEKFARALEAQSLPPEELVEKAFAVALSRPPSDAEMKQMTGFIQSQAESHGAGGNTRAEVDFCQLMLCLNEFVYID